MQYSHCPCAAAQFVVVLAEGVDCFPRAACDQVTVLGQALHLTFSPHLSKLDNPI
jgi:hypothetical protein